MVVSLEDKGVVLSSLVVAKRYSQTVFVRSRGSWVDFFGRLFSTSPGCCFLLEVMERIRRIFASSIVLQVSGQVSQYVVFPHFQSFTATFGFLLRVRLFEPLPWSAGVLFLPLGFAVGNPVPISLSLWAGKVYPIPF